LSSDFDHWLELAAYNEIRVFDGISSRNTWPEHNDFRRSTTLATHAFPIPLSDWRESGRRINDDRQHSANAS